MREKIKKQNFVFLLSLVLILLLSELVTAPPQPHNVKGHIFNFDGVNGVENGIPVMIEDINNSNSVRTEVYAPPIPSLKGAYSASINSSDNDMVNVTSWNSTHYGYSSAYLLPTTTEINVLLNITRPSETNVTITDPVNESVKEISNVFNVNASITIMGGQSGTNCYAEVSFSNSSLIELYNDDLVHSLGNINLGSTETTAWNVTGIKEGSSDISVSAYCDSDGVNFGDADVYTIYKITINDTTPPNVTNINPVNNSWINKENLTFYFNVSDISGIKSCGIYVDDALEKTDNNFQSDALSHFNLTELGEGNHSWYISCYDNSSNQNLGNSSISYINIDLTKPNVTSISPINYDNRSNNTARFEYNVTDNYGLVDNCSLILNETDYQTEYNIFENVTLNFTRYFIAGYYNWIIRCIDKANNFGYSETRFLNITDPDLAVYDYEIKFSKENPVENEIVEINATIHNIGNENATNVYIRFFEDEAFENQIGNNKIINLSSGSSITLSVNWTAKIGKYNIHVVADPPYETNGSISEINESNNLANNTIFIPTYHIYYGGIISDIILASSSMSYVLDWFNTTHINGNIYAADSDSFIDWNNLRAIGKDNSNNPSMDDFEDIDNSMNLTQFIDSINKSYTSEGKIKASDAFEVYGSSITDVPIINSTNSSNFVTGILWDSSDSNPGEYNGSQDLVFITRINRSMQGSYGRYDYEIKVPARLREYRTPNNKNRVSFYVELT
jgi:hypothetical protein